MEKIKDVLSVKFLKILLLLLFILCGYLLSVLFTSTVDYLLWKKEIEGSIRLLSKYSGSNGNRLQADTSVQLRKFVKRLLESDNMFKAVVSPNKESKPKVDVVSKQKEKKVNVKEATSLEDISVLGLVEGAQNMAILNVKGKIVFAIQGDSVGGYEIKSINRDYIELVGKNKTVYRLMLDFGEYKSETSAIASSLRNRRLVKKSSNEKVLKAGKQRVVSRSLINRLLANPYELLSKVRLIPYMKDGNPVGFRVIHLKKDNVLAELGVKNNDIVVSVNDIPIRNVGDVTNAIQSLMNSSTVSVEVLRKGKKIKLEYLVR